MISETKDKKKLCEKFDQKQWTKTGVFSLKQAKVENAMM